MNRKEIKKCARKSLRKNYFRTLIVVFIFGLVVGGGYNFGNKVDFTYIEKGIPFKALLYGLYVAIAIAGYRKWKSVAKTVKRDQK